MIAVFNFDFMGGSMGCAVGEGMVARPGLAVLQEAAFIVIPASGGARMQEGILSLMQMPRTDDRGREGEGGGPALHRAADRSDHRRRHRLLRHAGRHRDRRARRQIGFAGARVIEETIREKLPEGFQRAEYLLEHGMVDMVVHRNELRDDARRGSSAC